MSPISATQGAVLQRGTKNALSPKSGPGLLPGGSGIGGGSRANHSSPPGTLHGKVSLPGSGLVAAKCQVGAGPSVVSAMSLFQTAASGHSSSRLGLAFHSDSYCPGFLGLWALPGAHAACPGVVVLGITMQVPEAPHHGSHRLLSPLLTWC